MIDTNLKQRGIGNPNPIKLGRCIIELERIYGIRNGGSSFRGNQYIKEEELSNNFKAPKTQRDIANDIGMTPQMLINYKKLAESSPEIQDMLETGTIKPTVALKIITSMTEEEQEKFIKQNEVAKKEANRTNRSVRKNLLMIYEY
ncbi:hypothetical protein PBV87_11585 [Niameybacter massiliensis]|uniref:ParB/Spo0J HTH domain-containing protein n=1 Tax=Holtiella tumoricola TaxID=3018743 RepID=A0AA42J191_9FIRM|nr:hypothetical protein [Holtiella tumoricola]MDA3732125.1 hypothetical protein [Holtiella tumoricola]